MMTKGSLNHTLDRMLTLNRVLDEAFTSSWNGAPGGGRVWVPAADVVERTDAYLVTLDTPGVSPESIDVSFEQNVLTVRGTRAPSLDVSKETDVRIFSAERVTGAFERSVRLPEFVDSENISAELRHGVLYLTVPKAQSARARRIPVKAAEQQKVGG